MANEHPEKDFEDEVYEDEYYEEHYEEEELVDDSVEELELEEGDWENEKKVSLSFACEDCDYRWDDVVIKRKTDIDVEDDYSDMICPMCGSMNVTQI